MPGSSLTVPRPEPEGMARKIDDDESPAKKARLDMENGKAVRENDDDNDSDDDADKEE